MFLRETLPYDYTNPLLIEKYAKLLEGKRFNEIYSNADNDNNGESIFVDEGVTSFGHSSLEEIETVKENGIKSGNKGGLGQLLEEGYFYLRNNSDSDPDFKEAGVELKATPMRLNRDKTLSAKERLVLNIINYMKIQEEEFINSSFMKKNKLLLLIFYLYESEISRLEYIIKFARLFQFPEKDMLIIRDDWNIIVTKIRQGKAHELSESDTNYLAACTKGVTKESVRPQPFSDIKAKQRAFSLKQSYMTAVINEYIIKGKKTYEDSLVKSSLELKDKTFEMFVNDKVKRYIGLSMKELADMFSITTDIKSKNYTAVVAEKIILNILGVNSDKIEEFQKASIKTKTIRISKNGKIKEHMSFPAFKFSEIIKEDWETSALREMLLNTRFLFIIYRFDKNDVLRLYESMFWNIPYDDLETEVCSVWNKTVDTIKEGVRVIKTAGKRDFNNLPNPAQNRVSHVRPHGRDKNDTYPLPTGGVFPKQCFWLNNGYILEQIKKAKG